MTPISKIPKIRFFEGFEKVFVHKIEIKCVFFAENRTNMIFRFERDRQRKPRSKIPSRKKVRPVAIFTFFSGRCFLPIFFWKKCIFWDWPKSRGMVSKNEIFEKIFFSAKTLKNTKTKHFAAFWVKKRFLKSFFLGQIFSKFFLIFFNFFFQLFQKFQIFKFEAIEK